MHDHERSAHLHTHIFILCWIAILLFYFVCQFCFFFLVFLCVLYYTIVWFHVRTNGKAPQRQCGTPVFLGKQTNTHTQSPIPPMTAQMSIVRMKFNEWKRISVVAYIHKKFVRNNFCLCFISCLINISKKNSGGTNNIKFFLLRLLFGFWAVRIRNEKKQHNNVRIAWNSSVWTNSKRTMQTNEKGKNGIVKKWSATNKWFTCTHTNRLAFSSFATKIYTSHEVWFMKSKARIHWPPSHWNSMWLIHWNGSNTSWIHFICFAYLSLYFLCCLFLILRQRCSLSELRTPKWTGMNLHKQVALLYWMCEELWTLLIS